MKIMYFKVKDGEIRDLDALARKLTTAAIPVLIVTAKNVVYAGKITQQLKPLIAALQDLAEPVAYAFLIFGGIKYMTGKKLEAKKMITAGIGGYIFIQWIPWIFGIIRGIGAPVAGDAQ